MEKIRELTAAEVVAAKENGSAIHSQSEVRGNNLCVTQREFADLGLQSQKSVAMDNAIIAYDILTLFNKGEIEIDEISELVDEGLEDNFETTLTGKKRKEQLVKLLTRYCRSEKRKLFVPEEAKHFSIDGSVFRIRPHAVAFESNGTIEAIIYRNSLPNVTQTGKKRDGSVEKCTELYLLLEYLKTLVPYGETRDIKASYYFLKKNGDTRKWSCNFFDGEGNNIVSLEDTYTNDGDDNAAPTDVEKKLAEQIAEWEVGRECSGEDCETCKFNMACNFVKSPEHSEKKSSTGKKKEVIPTPDQAKVINFDEGVARVVAGAGAGKTESVVQRVVKLITKMVEAGVQLSEAAKCILMITFTEAGCREMKQRVVARLQDKGIFLSATDMVVRTFNQFAYDIVRKYYGDLSFTKEPKVIDDVRMAVIVSDMLEKYPIPNLDYLHFSMNDKNNKGALICAVAVFQKMKELQLDPLDTDTIYKIRNAIQEQGFNNNFIDDNAVSQLISLYEKFEKRLIEDNLLLFADQEPMMLKVIELHPELVDEMGFKHIIVDEFQDSNTVQMETIKLFKTGRDFKSLMVVGDDSQSIFGFRNTTPENILHFFEKMGIPEGEGIDLRLVDNHRSTPEILLLANNINALNKERIDKDLVASRPSTGDKPVIKGFHDKKAEYAYIATEVKRLIDEGIATPEEIAFISFTNAELVKMGAALSAAGVPWVMMNPTVLMTNSKVQAALALAEAFWEPESTVLYFNYLTTLYNGEILSLDKNFVSQQIGELKSKFMNISEMEIPAQRQVFHNMLEALKQPHEFDENGEEIVLEEEGEDEIFNYFLELLYQCEDFQTELKYVSDFKRYGTKVAKRMEQSYQGVVLTTAHSSKGLEWKVVFNSLTGYDNAFLHGNHQTELEERRRLLFVSLTRARDLLYVTGQYVAFGDEQNRTYNQFLREAFEQNGEEYDPVDPMEAIRKAERKAKAAEAARKRREKAKDSWAKLTNNMPGQRSFG